MNRDLARWWLLKRYAILDWERFLYRSGSDVRKAEVSKFSELVGKTIKSITGMDVGSEQVVFTCSDGSVYWMQSDQPSYDYVSVVTKVEDVSGDYLDLLGTPVLQAEEVSSDVDDERECSFICSSFTWTFYKISTIKGSVTLRWLGESNGCYSESVDFELVSNPDPKPTNPVFRREECQPCFKNLVASREPDVSLPGAVQLECPVCGGSGCQSCGGRGWLLAAFEGSSGCCDTSTSEVVGNGTEYEERQ